MRGSGFFTEYKSAVLVHFFLGTALVENLISLGRMAHRLFVTSLDATLAYISPEDGEQFLFCQSTWHVFITVIKTDPPTSVITRLWSDPAVPLVVVSCEPIHLDNFLFCVSGSPAELSPSTLSPVNHSMGKTQTNKQVCCGKHQCGTAVEHYLHTRPRRHHSSCDCLAELHWNFSLLQTCSRWLTQSQPSGAL